MKSDNPVKHISFKQRLALELNRRLIKNMREMHVLRQLFWECTLRCNLSCRHCGSDCKHSSTQPDMPLADFLKVIDSITPHVDTHKTLIILSGGEPTMRKDLEEIGKALHERQYPWGMVTNGMLLSETRLRTLVANGLRSITVSVDGLEEDHNWMRGHKQSYSNAINAVRSIAKYPQLTWDVVTCVNQRNIHSLHQLKALLLQHGVKQWRLFTIFPQGRATQHDQMHLNTEQHHLLMTFIKEERTKGEFTVTYQCEGFLGGYETEVRNHPYQCSAGVSIGGVLCNGDITACTSIRCNYVQGNIYTDNFWEVWQNRYQPYRNRQWMRTHHCATCSMFRYCEGGGMHMRDDSGNMTFCQYRSLSGLEQ